MVGFERNCGELQWQGSELKKKSIGFVIELSISFQGDVLHVRLAIFVDFTT